MHDNAGALAIDPLPGDGANDPTNTAPLQHRPELGRHLRPSREMLRVLVGHRVVWEYDRGDFSLRLDIDSGPLERILIDAEQGADDTMPYFRGNRGADAGPAGVAAVNRCSLQPG